MAKGQKNQTKLPNTFLTDHKTDLGSFCLFITGLIHYFSNSPVETKYLNTFPMLRRIMTITSKKHEYLFLLFTHCTVVVSFYGIFLCFPLLVTVFCCRNRGGHSESEKQENAQNGDKSVSHNFSKKLV